MDKSKRTSRNKRQTRSERSPKFTSESESDSDQDSSGDDDEEKENEIETKPISRNRKLIASVNEVTLDETLINMMPPKIDKLSQNMNKLSIDESVGNETMINSKEQALTRVTVRSKCKNSNKSCKSGSSKLPLDREECTSVTSMKDLVVDRSKLNSSKMEKVEKVEKKEMARKEETEEEFESDSNGVPVSPVSNDKICNTGNRHRRFRVTSQSKLTTGVRQMLPNIPLTPVAQRTRQKHQQQQRMQSSVTGGQTTSRLLSTNTFSPNRQRSLQRVDKFHSAANVIAATVDNVPRRAFSGSRILCSSSIKKRMPPSKTVGQDQASGESDYESNAVRDLLAKHKKNQKSVLTNLDSVRLQAMLQEQERARAAESNCFRTLSASGQKKQKFPLRKGQSQTTIQSMKSKNRRQILKNEC